MYHEATRLLLKLEKFFNETIFQYKKKMYLNLKEDIVGFLIAFTKMSADFTFSFSKLSDAYKMPVSTVTHFL